MKNRSELREIIMKVIYQTLLLDEFDLEELIKEQIEVENDFVNDTCKGIIDKKKDLYTLANKYLKDWKMERLNKVDQAIICLGVYVLMYTDTPSVVCINEAIELSKKYSDEAVTAMINGVLDKIYHEEEK